MEDELNIDAIVAETEASTNNEIPMEGNSPPVEAAPTTPQEYEFESNGQKIKAPIEKILRWASMGHSAPNKIGELSNKLKEFESKSETYQSYEKTYAPIDQWAKQNPDKWNALVNHWQQAQYGALPTEPGQPAVNLPPEVIQKLQEHDQRWQKMDEIERNQKIQASDQSLDQEVKSIREQYANLDFDAPDEKGKPLELQILEHATRNGIPSFRAAFRDYCFDKLGAFSESKGREMAAMPSKTKAGLLGRNPTPAGTRTQAPDLKGRNYDQIHAMILEKELGITG